MNWRTCIAAGILAASLAGVSLHGQQRGGGAPAPTTGRAAAVVDLTGYWVSVVTEDWRFRMVTPPKGDYTSLPLNKAGRDFADQWDYQKDTAAGLQCKAYGAAGIMRVPGRLHITWENDSTLKVETDAGTQVRRFQFGSNPAIRRAATSERTWQGVSSAAWDVRKIEASGLGITDAPRPRPARSLKVTTSNLRAGYLRTNGVPYSENTQLTEYYDIIAEPEGRTWLVVTTIVDDPTYLLQPFITTTHFKREADGSKWRPTPCEIVPPTRGPRPAFPQ